MTTSKNTHEEARLLQEEVLNKLKETKKRIEKAIELVEKYGVNDPDVNTDLYLFARDELLKLLECIFRVTTTNSKFESLVTVLRKIVLSYGNLYDLEDFRAIVVLHNYKVMLSIYAENVGGNTEFYVLEKDFDEKEFEEIYNQIKKMFENTKDITNYTPPVNIV